MKGSSNFWEHMDLPGESLPGQALVEIMGNGRVLIEYHAGVREYGPERVCVKVKYGFVQICGSCLKLRCMTPNQLLISGRIDAVYLNREDR